MSGITPEQLNDQLAALKAAITSRPAMSPRGLDEYRWSVELARKVHEDERRRWNQERHDLNRYISSLEYALSIYQDKILEKYMNSENSYGPTSKEVWLGTGGQSDSKPTNISEVSSSHVSKQAERRGGIAESGPSKDSNATFVMGTGISVPRKDQMRDFDGILFKENIRAPPIAESLRAMQSVAPDHFQSVARGIPAADAKPRTLLPSPMLPDGTNAEPPPQVPPEWDSSAVSSTLATPVRTDPKKLSREPFPSAAKRPSERAHEDVPRLKSDKASGDVELKGPLGLKNNKAEDSVFLRELNSKLNEAAKARDAHEADKSKEHDSKAGNAEEADKSKEHDSKARDVGEASKSKEHGSKEDVGIRKPQPGVESEVEPALQLKPTLNFGTPFGTPHCGKGV